MKLLKITMILMFTSILLFEFGKYLVEYFIIFPQNSAQNFRYGYKQLYKYLSDQENNYNQITISNKLDQSHQYIFQLFFQKIEPNFYHNPLNISRSFDEEGWVIVSRIGKYHYVPSSPNIDELPPKSLLVVTKGEINFPTALVHKIDDPQRKNVFEIYNVDMMRIIK